MLLRDVADQLLDEDGLAHSRAAEQANLAALGVRGEQVDDLDARLEDLARRREVLDARCRTVDRPALLGLDVAALVDRLAEQVEDASERVAPDRDGDRPAGVAHLGAAREAIGGVHRDRADAVVAEVLLHLEHERAGLVLVLLVAVALQVHLEGVVDLGQLVGERDLDHDSLDLLDGADVAVALGLLLFCLRSSFHSSPWLTKSFGPGDDLHDLLRDLRLPLAVRGEREVVDQLGGVV